MNPVYLSSMAEAHLDLNAPNAMTDDEDEGTIAAIRRGVRDAEDGRVTPIEEVEKMLPQWISKSSSPTKT
jgi:predicted transcriptional regulator